MQFYFCEVCAPYCANQLLHLIPIINSPKQKNSPPSCNLLLFFAVFSTVSVPFPRAEWATFVKNALVVDAELRGTIIKKELTVIHDRLIAFVFPQSTPSWTCPHYNN
jgi:hypothetical protein